MQVQVRRQPPPPPPLPRQQQQRPIRRHPHRLRRRARPRLLDRVTSERSPNRTPRRAQNGTSAPFRISGSSSKWSLLAIARHPPRYFLLVTFRRTSMIRIRRVYNPNRSHP